MISVSLYYVIMTENLISRKIPIPGLIVDPTNNIRYKRDTFLGKGAFGKCFRLTNLNSGDVFAGKFVAKELLKKYNMKEKIIQEISIHRTLKHKNIVGFNNFFEDKAFIYITLELCRRQSMLELQKRREKLTDPEVRYYMKQILSAVEFLHDRNIIHRDLKLGNLFINDDMEIKLGDFGLATYIGKGEKRLTMCGTPNYIAPEILEGKGHGFEVDVWAIGCIVFILLVGKPPFEAASMKEVYRRIKRCEYNIPSSVNTHAAYVISKIFVKDPNMRPCVKELIQEKFFKEGFIPNSLPASCLVMTPQFNMSIPHVATPIKRKALSDISNSDKPETKKLNKGIHQEKSTKITADKFPSLKECHILNNLKDQLLNVLYSNPTVKDPKFSEEAQDPTAQPILWISSWIDYSYKYGFAYKLCDDSIGIVFRDSTKLILHSNKYIIQYIDHEGFETYFTISDYDASLKKKIQLLNLFQKSMDSLINTGSSRSVKESDCFTRLPVVCDWIRCGTSVVILLSNDTLQINFLSDHSKIILCPLLGAVTFINKREEFQTLKLNLIEEYGCSKDLEWRLQYAVQKIDDMLKRKKEVTCRKE